jgi:uncharacterized iron-regulated membrane protein
MGEVSCLAAAVLVLPAGWYWIEKRRRAARVVLRQPRVPRVD